MAKMGIRRGIAQRDYGGGFGQKFMGKVSISCIDYRSAKL